MAKPRHEPKKWPLRKRIAGWFRQELARIRLNWHQFTHWWKIDTSYSIPEGKHRVQETRWCLHLGENTFKIHRYRFEERTTWLFEKLRRVR